MHYYKKLFKRCPHDKRRTCKGCPIYLHCVAKKIRRRIKKATKSYKMPNILWICLICVVAITMATIYTNTNKQKNKIEQENEVVESITIDFTSNVALYTSAFLTEMDVSFIIKEEEEEEQETEEITEPEQQEATISAYAPSETYYYTVTEEEKQALAKIVYQEARGESFEGQVAVAAVALNRYESKNEQFNTSSIMAVITQKSQFADISQVTQEELDSVPSCEDAVEAALKGWDPTRVEFENGALFFFACDANELQGEQKEIREGIHTYKIGAHYFHENFDKL